MISEPCLVAAHLPANFKSQQFKLLSSLYKYPPKIEQNTSKHPTKEPPQPSNPTKHENIKPDTAIPSITLPPRTQRPHTHDAHTHTTLFSRNGLLTKSVLFRFLGPLSKTSPFLFNPKGGRGPGPPIWLGEPCVLPSMLDAAAAWLGRGVTASSSASKMPYRGPVPMSFARGGCGVAGGREIGTSITDSGAIELMRKLGADDCSGLGLASDAEACGCSWSWSGLTR